MSLGRLRPHFFAVCDPAPGNCTDGHGFQRYVTDYECQGAGRRNPARIEVKIPAVNFSTTQSTLFGFFH